MKIAEILFMLILIRFLGHGFILRDVLGVLQLHLSSREGTGVQGSFQVAEVQSLTVQNKLDFVLVGERSGTN